MRKSTLIRREFADVLRTNPHISNFIEIDVRKGRAFAGKLRIRATGYDVILDLQGNLRSFWLRLFWRCEVSSQDEKKQSVAAFAGELQKSTGIRKFTAMCHPLRRNICGGRSAARHGHSRHKTELHLHLEIREATDTRWQNWRKTAFTR